MADDWVTPSAINDKCGEHVSYPVANFIDEDVDTKWNHETTEEHWVILDMGETYTVKKVRIYHKPYQSYGGPAAIYVTDNLEVLGDSVGATSANYWEDAEAYEEIDTTDKDGRYIKLVSASQAQTAWFEFDIYGDVAAGEGYTLEIGSGSFTETGQTVGLLKANKLGLGAGTFTWTGFTVTLTKAVHYILEVLAGVFALTGSSVTLVQKDGDYIIPRPTETDYVELTKTPTDYTELEKPTTPHTELSSNLTEYTSIKWFGGYGGASYGNSPYGGAYGEYTEESKPSSDYTELTKPTTVYTEE